MVVRHQQAETVLQGQHYKEVLTLLEAVLALAVVGEVILEGVVVLVLVEAVVVL
jgi:hypothetical protein